MSTVEYPLMGPPVFTGRFGVNGDIDGPVQTHTGVDVRKSCRERWELMCVCVGGVMVWSKVRVARMQSIHV